ncbi:enoyl-CoA hydratase/isomerase family protein [Amycolatopsis sp.]|uniref:enoyl-CoA hydratase/isomerase family protein n=1 Tax=Amycolatopsis sp. TaxID=37632 RepID=UPI002B6402B4|nr:enoyl-CoA hydratase-related protein [Amycolatopsis sp.]HVV10532.1 enoyl-CoA hydratase-related protein [Amycolatopsis sp.]
MNGKRAGEVLLRATENVVGATIDRPAARNAIDGGVIEGLAAAVDLAEETGARVLTIRGAGGTFCAGADLGCLERMRSDPARVEKFMAALGEVLDRIEAAPFGTVAVVEGFAVAGGCELLLACDVVVAATTARIGDRHAELGLAPAAGGSVRLARLPKARANYLLLSGELLSGEEAEHWGLVTMAVAPQDVELVADEVVTRLAGRSGQALAVTKRMLAGAKAEALLQERELFVRHVGSADVGEGLAAFRERRLPVFDGKVRP